MVFKQIDFPHCFFFQKILEDVPEDGDGVGDADHVADEHAFAVGVREEGEGAFHGADEGKQSIVGHIHNCHPTFHLSRNQIISNDVLEEVGLGLKDVFFGHVEFDYFIHVENENGPIVAIPPRYIKYAFFEVFGDDFGEGELPNAILEGDETLHVSNTLFEVAVRR